MDLGYITHAVHANVRMVVLTCTLSSSGKTLTVTGPPSAGVYPPGPGFLYIVVDEVPSVGKKVMIGDGRAPPTDENAIAKCVCFPVSFSLVIEIDASSVCSETLTQCRILEGRVIRVARTDDS